MKRSNALILMIICLLAIACGPTTASKAVEAPQPLPSATDQPTPTPLPMEKVPVVNDRNSPIATPVIDRGHSPIPTPMTDSETSLTATRPAGLAKTFEELPPEAATLVAKAEEMLSQVPGVDPDAEITLLKAEAKQWRDSSLGCPREGMMYSQVITPGYLFVFQVGDDKQYEFHTDTRETIVLCFIDGKDALEVLQR